MTPGLRSRLLWIACWVLGLPAFFLMLAEANAYVRPRLADLIGVDEMRAGVWFCMAMIACLGTALALLTRPYIGSAHSGA